MTPTTPALTRSAATHVAVYTTTSASAAATAPAIAPATEHTSALAQLPLAKTSHEANHPAATVTPTLALMSAAATTQKYYRPAKG